MPAQSALIMRSLRSGNTAAVIVVRIEGDGVWKISGNAPQAGNSGLHGGYRF